MRRRDSVKFREHPLAWCASKVTSFCTKCILQISMVVMLGCVIGIGVSLWQKDYKMTYAFSIGLVSLVYSSSKY